MALTETRRQQLMVYCRLGDLDEQEQLLLDQTYEASVGYLAEAGVKEPEAGTPRKAQYDLAVNALVLDAWDARGSQTETSALRENPGFRRLINQLKLSER